MSEMAALDTVHCADALTLLRAQNDCSIDAIITDLPYGETSCAWDVVIPFEPMWKEVKRVLKPRGVFVTTAIQPFTSALVMSNPKWFRYEWIWHKSAAPNFGNFKIRPLADHEEILVFSQRPPVYYPQPRRRTVHSRSGGGKHIDVYHAVQRQKTESANDDKGNPKSVLFFNTPFHDREAGFHPTQKPVALYEYLIRTYTREGEVVLDFCCGSGTTALAARSTKRHFIVGDNSEKYIAAAHERLRLPFEPHAIKQIENYDDLPMFAMLNTAKTLT